ncbi:unnamed protein product [Orchesella dallaii]|uniref:Ubiquitin-like domain-containing protein n=1 Tax=Orchesella dallaii TaxID=48710 RepID=A0ABP1QP55_9HEXA
MSKGKAEIQIKLDNGCKCLKPMEFMVKLCTPFKTTAEKYAEACGFERNQLRFSYNGKRLNIQKTPREMRMANGSTIKVEHDPDLVFEDVKAAYIRMKTKELLSSTNSNQDAEVV